MLFICLSSNFGSLSYLQPFVNNFFISFLLSVSVATFIYYHICYCLSTTFSTHFSELSHRFPRWTFNISLLSQLVKGICAIFLYKSTRHFPACSHNFPKAGEARFQGLSRLFRLLGKFPYLGESRRILMAVSSKTSSKTRFCYAATRRISSAAVQPSIWA